jgi:hypothetical protein
MSLLAFLTVLRFLFECDRARTGDNKRSIVAALADNDRFLTSGSSFK